MLFCWLVGCDINYMYVNNTQKLDNSLHTCLDKGEYPLQAFKYWYDKSCKTEGIDNPDEEMNDYQVSHNMLRAFKCIECVSCDIVPVLNESSPKTMSRFIKKTKTKTKDKISKPDTKVEKKTDKVNNKDCASTGQDVKTYNDEDETTEAPDSLDMEASFGLNIESGANGDETDFVRIKSNGVIKLAQGDPSTFTLKSRENPSKPSNYGMIIKGHLEKEHLGEVKVTVTVDDNKKLVANITSGGVTEREIFDIIYDDTSPGAFRLYNGDENVKKYVGTNNNGVLMANVNTSVEEREQAQGMFMYRYLNFFQCKFCFLCDLMLGL